MSPPSPSVAYSTPFCHVFVILSTRLWPLGPGAVSAAAVWEIATKVAVGKLRLPADTTDYLRSRFTAFDFNHLPITYEHTLATGHLPMHHRDPFDRILIAQALLEGLTIITGDRLFGQYGVATLMV